MSVQTKGYTGGSPAPNVSRMKKWLAGLLVWLLRALLGANLEGPELDGVRCGSCQNYFWITDAHIEPPTFCPYCGIRFTGHRKISGADFGHLGN